MACARYIGLLRPRLQVRDGGEPGPACSVPLAQGGQALGHEAASLPASDVGGVLEVWDRRCIKVYINSLDLWVRTHVLWVLGYMGIQNMDASALFCGYLNRTTAGVRIEFGPSHRPCSVLV